MASRIDFYDRLKSPKDHAVVKYLYLRLLVFYVTAIVLTLVVSSAVHKRPTSVDTTASINTLGR